MTGTDISLEEIHAAREWRYLASLAIGERQIKIRIRYHYTCKSKNKITTSNAGEYVRKLDHSYIAGCNGKWYTNSGE